MWLSKPSVTKACKFSLLISLRHDRTAGVHPALCTARPAASVQSAGVARWLFAHRFAPFGVRTDRRPGGPCARWESPSSAAVRRSESVPRPETERFLRSVRTPRHQTAPSTVDKWPRTAVAATQRMRKTISNSWDVATPAIITSVPSTY